MPRSSRSAGTLAAAAVQIGRMQQALTRLQGEIAKLIRTQERDRPRDAARRPATLRAALQAAEQQAILEVGEECGWNRTRMARALKVDRKSLYRKMQAYDLVDAHPAPYVMPSRKRPKATRRAAARRR